MSNVAGACYRYRVTDIARDIQTRAESTEINIDVTRWLLIMFLFVPYAVALATGFTARCARYVVAAGVEGYLDGMNGRSRDKPKG